MAKPLINKTKSGIPQRELSLALAEATKCGGCGIECECFGYLSLPNWISATGERQDGYVLYIVDGVLKVATKATAEAEIQGYKDL